MNILLSEIEEKTTKFKLYSTKEISILLDIPLSKLSYIIDVLKKNKLIDINKNEKGFNFFSEKNMFLIRDVWKHVKLGAYIVESYNYLKKNGPLPIYHVSKKTITRELNIDKHKLDEAIKKLTYQGYNFKKMNSTIVYQRKDMPFIRSVIEEENIILQLKSKIDKIDVMFEKSKLESSHLFEIIDNCQKKINECNTILNIDKDDSLARSILNKNVNILKQLNNEFQIAEGQKEKNGILLTQYKSLLALEKQSEQFGDQILNISLNNMDFVPFYFPYEKIVVDEQDDEYISFEFNFLDTLSQSEKLIIKVIGEHGVSRNQELREILESNRKDYAIFFIGGRFNYQHMSSSVKSLRDGGFLESEKVKLNSKSQYDFTVYELTSLGKANYKSLTNKKAVLSEKKLITDQHGSLEDGFLIKDFAQVFKEMDYMVYKSIEKKRQDFDIAVEKNNKIQYIRIEKGNHTDEDFFNMMERIYQVTNEFYFIVPNEEKLFGKTKIQVFKWIKERLGGMDKAKGKITVHFATYEKMKKKLPNPWDTIVF